VGVKGTSDTLFRTEHAARSIHAFVAHGQVGRYKKNKVSGWLAELTEFMGNANGEHDSRMSTFGSKFNSAYRQVLEKGDGGKPRKYRAHTVLNKEAGL